MKHGWEYKKLGDCFSYIKNGANIKQDKSGLGFPITRIETLSSGRFNRDKVGFAGITEIEKYRAYVLNDKDLLMSHINSKAYIGRTVLYRKEGDESIIHGMNLLRLVANEKIDSCYFAALAQSTYFKEQIAKIRKDAVNQSSFAISDLQKIQIPVPPLPVQEQICSLLDKMNRVIEAKKEQLKELDNLAQAIFYEMFGDVIINDRGWGVRKWNDCLTIFNGRNQKQVENANGQYPICGSGGVMGRANQYITPENSVIVGRKGNINKPILMREKFWNVDTAFGIHPNGKELLVDYLYYFCVLFDFEQLNKAVTIPSLTKTDLLGLDMPVPPLPLQQSFTEKVEAIERQKELINQSIKDVQTLFDAKMDYYFGD